MKYQSTSTVVTENPCYYSIPTHHHITYHLYFRCDLNTFILQMDIINFNFYKSIGILCFRWASAVHCQKQIQTPSVVQQSLNRSTSLMFGEQTTKRRYLVNLDFSFYQHNLNNIAQTRIVQQNQNFWYQSISPCKNSRFLRRSATINTDFGL